MKLSQTPGVALIDILEGCACDDGQNYSSIRSSIKRTIMSGLRTARYKISSSGRKWLECVGADICPPGGVLITDHVNGSHKNRRFLAVKLQRSAVIVLS
ncbi:hypothetical protein PoB_007242100 [Plakobranchus ocellatus]|uniref:Uncharacterized protein n=1 Tax=Plakobranchus ocellatus TaxID=259542 RepID=A0AAV4DPZ0_9GAST|nr:hypothetical protein PoB_007242100 [Plakobranchus ocellatus]